jgi:predicted nucleic acid-binding protein
MKPYWDSSALVECFVDPELRIRLSREGGLTRTHSLAEIFSALTKGNLTIRVEASAAARMLTDIARHLEFVDLSSIEVLHALEQTRRRGVRGGRVHDFLHAVAAEKAKASLLLTADENDFESLLDSVQIEQV